MFLKGKKNLMRNLVNVMREEMNARSNEKVRELASAGISERLLYSLPV